MILTEVISSADKEEFHSLPKILYSSDPNWICPLDDSVESVFNPMTNPNSKPVRP